MRFQVDPGLFLNMKALVVSERFAIMIIDIFDVVTHAFFIVTDHAVIEGGHGNIKIFSSRRLECNRKTIATTVVSDHLNYNRLGIDIHSKVHMQYI